MEREHECPRAGHTHFCQGAARRWIDGIVLAACMMLVPIAAGDTIVFQEFFENGNSNGWDFDSEGGDALDGFWEIGDPNGTMWETEPAQPEDAFEGMGCAFTQYNLSVGQGDVDDGVVYFISPEIDLSAYSGAQLAYARWFYNRYLGGDPNDFFRAQVRESATLPWVDLEVLDYNQNANAWVQQEFSLEEHVSLTDTVQFQFVASDGDWPAPGDLIEAAIDAVTVTAIDGCADSGDCDPGEYCNSAHVCVAYGDGDFEGDGDVDLEDFTEFQRCFGSMGTGGCAPANMAGEETIDAEDYAAFAGVLDGPG